MKRTSAELKRIARENLQGHYGLPMGAMVVAGLITSVALMPFSLILDIYRSLSDLIFYQLASIIISLISVILSAGLIRIHLKLARKETPVFSDLFYGFTRRPDRFILSSLLLAAIAVVCMLPGIICIALFLINDSVPLLLMGVLFILGAMVPLVILELHFDLVFILLADYDSMGVMEAFRKSYQLMAGNKGRLFYIQLSFIGWELLSILSCYIGMLWLAPYMSQTSISFYRDVTGELDAPEPFVP